MSLHTQVKEEEVRREERGKEEKGWKGRGKEGKGKGPHACNPRVWKVEEERTRQSSRSSFQYSALFSRPV